MSSDPTTGPAEEQSRCTACNSPIPAGARRCEKCGAGQDHDVRCRICGQFLPPKAKRCKECNSFRDRRPHLTAVSLPVISLLIALFGAGSTFLINLPKLAELSDPHSHTTVAFHSATNAAINISVVNTGRKTATLREYSLHFDDPLMPDVPLALVPSVSFVPVNVVPAGNQIALSLTSDSIPETMPKDKMLEWLETHQATIEVAVRESNDGPDGAQVRTVTLPAKQIGLFLFKKTYG
jgi:hypothetical protein